MKTTDDVVYECHELGITLEEASVMAWNYISSGRFETVSEFIEVDRLGRIDISDENVGEDTDEEIFDFDHEDEAPTRIFDIGCDFKGCKEINEDDREDMYIPSSYYCILKCYEKSFERNKGIIDTYKTVTGNTFSIPRDKISPYGMCNKKARRVYMKALMLYLHNAECTCTNRKCDNCKRYKLDELIPEHYKISDKKIVTLSKLKNKTVVNDSVLLGHYKGSSYHAILLKQRIPKKLNEYNLKVSFISNTALEMEQVRIKAERARESDEYIIVYDIETYWNDQTPRKAIPYALGYALVNLRQCKSEKPEIITIREHANIFNVFFEKMRNICKNLGIWKLQVFAHNGSRFDNIFAKSATNVKIESSIIVGTNNKKIIFKNVEDSIYFEFKDTHPFVLSSLKNALKNYNCVNQKLELDIGNYTLEMYDNDKAWIEYLEHDVRGLAELSMRVDQSLSDFGESITTCLGAPSFAWKLMRKSCYNSDGLFCPKSPSLKKFMRASCYGGRVLHWKKKFISKKGEKMVCMDYNSLYPSSMYNFPFPTGKARLIPDNFERYLMSPEYPHYIIEATIRAGNVRYPIHPYKTIKNNLIYKSGTFTGVYNDVDIREMIRDGYEIINIKRGVYWIMSEKIFSHLVDSLYELRKEQKKNNDPKEYTTKIILNSIFGKFMESIRTTSAYNKPRNEEYVISKTVLANGHTEYIKKLEHDMDINPVYIGGYIMSYARKLMNEYIDKIGRENIYYSDCDSLYLKTSDMKDIQLGNDLCEMKNDYGEGKYITYAHFIDLKRYLVVFNDGSAKAKFQGLNFITRKVDNVNKTYIEHDDIIELSEQKTFTGDNVQKIIKLYNDLADTEINDKSIQIVQEKWMRAGNEIKIDVKAIGYSISPSKRANWIEDVYIPLGYDIESPERYIVKGSDYAQDGPISHIYKKPEVFYRVVNNVIKSRVPLVYSDKTARVPKIFTEFYLFNKKLYKKNGDELQMSCRYGRTCVKPIPFNDKAVMITHLREGGPLSYLPTLDDSEANQLFNHG